jgi:hypothetical protein
VPDDEKATTAARFLLRRTSAHFHAHGMRVEPVMIDNGSAYISLMHALASKALGLKHLA